MWQALYQTFNSAQNCQVNTQLLDKIPSNSPLEWPSFLKEEFKSVISKYSNLFTPRPDCISWRYLKVIIDGDKCLSNIVNIVNACINLGHWPSRCSPQL